MSETSIIREAVETFEGDGVIVRRLFPVAGQRNHDPFVLWDHFNIEAGTGFPTHPHRGFEAITYLFSGSMEHADNLGNQSTIGPGGAQRFTAGRGIVHSEMPGTGGTTQGIQLWINLPKRLKQIEPAYQEIQAAEIPVTQWDGGSLHTIVGKQGPVQLQTPVDYFELNLNPGGHFAWTPELGHQGLIYVVSGDATINQQLLETGFAMLINQPEPIAFDSASGAKIMVCFGGPHQEPIFQHGPFVD